MAIITQGVITYVNNLILQMQVKVITFVSMELTDVNERVLYLMQHLELSKTAFANAIGINPSVLSHIASKRNKPSADMLINIVSVYTQVSADWLLTGKGDMVKDGNSNNILGAITELFNELSLLNDVNHQSVSLRLDTIKNKLLNSV